MNLFSGSGSTLIAAEQTGRRAFLMEIDLLYCDVIITRFEKFSGRKAERISDRSNAPVVADSITIFVGSAVRTRCGAKPSVRHRPPMSKGHGPPDLDGRAGEVD